MHSATACSRISPAASNIAQLRVLTIIPLDNPVQRVDIGLG
jgi:hypothetical protein